MEKIGFIGAYDKIDIIMYIAKALTIIGKKVIVIDSTVNQKAKYIVPAISPSTSYITEYEGVDVAVGLYSFTDLEQYLGVEKFETCGYDIALFDIDDFDMIDSFNIYNANKNYFVTSFDLFSLKRGIEILSGITGEAITLTKILFSKEMLKDEDDYLNFLALGKKIKWTDEMVYFPIDNGDLSVIIENQRMMKMKIKNLSSSYKESLMYIVEQITGEKDNNIRRAFKQMWI